ncbi:hypothetical protein [Spirosoma sp.]|uniref:hypothetical protein n=1 Tax=Spirosoma sp. TaxID=1899569 RepID=UPI00262C898F|nr:hypothetical protein [Spirosoma sp.]MCX6216493.1 hypothetical protein [Spirosoma sp.]
MPVTLVSSPDPYSLSKGGRTLYRFSGSGRYASTGVKAVTSLIIKGQPVPDGTVLRLRWNGKVITLTARTTPTLPTEFPAGNGSSAYATILAIWFGSLFAFRSDFTISRVDAGIWSLIKFTARKPGVAYTISLDNNTGAGPIDLGVDTAGADPVLRVQYSVYCAVYLQKPGSPGTDLEADYEQVFAPVVEMDSDGLAQFDVGAVLHDALKADWPDWSASTTTLSHTSARKYYLAYAEAYGSPIEVGRLYTDQVRYILLGGTDYQHRASGGQNLLQRYTNDPAADPALRFGATTRVVRPDEPQFLSFLNSRVDRLGSALLITLTFDDDSQLVMNDVLSQPVDVLAGQKVTFAVGAPQQKLFDNLPAGRILKEYTVRWVGTSLGTSPLSAEYRFILNYDYQPHTRYFAYLTSLGVVDTLATFGKGSSELARFYEQAEVYLPALYELADGQFTDYGISLQRSVEVTTGFRSQTELRRWDDFYRSPKQFRLVDAQALPVGITAKSIKENKDGDTQFAHRFEYVYLFKDDFYAEGTEAAEPLLPPGFVGGGGTVVIQPTQTVYAVDPTVPAFVRNLTAVDIAKFQVAAARPNPETLGFLNQTTAAGLFRGKEPISFATDITDKPTTRDASGLTDVPTVSEIFKTAFIKPHLSSWTGDQEPPQLL